MIAADDVARHEEAWLLLPWLANGRISPADREKVEEHVRACASCTRELEFQRLVCRALTEPDRVTYAPGPSFRKLLDRIDGAPQPKQAPAPARQGIAPPGARAPSRSGALLWRPPGLAWAASFILVVGLAGAVTTAYRWSQPVYVTHTDERAPTNVLHIAFDRSLTIGAVEELLRSAGARVVEGPGSTGIFGVEPVDLIAGKANNADAARELSVLSARLRADPRVRWVEPVAGGADAAENGPPGSRRGL